MERRAVSATLTMLLTFSLLVSAFHVVPTAIGNVWVSTDWNRTYGGPQADFAYSMVQTGDGGYAIAGSTLSFGAGNGDFWLVKTDAFGNAQWNKTYGGGTKGEIAYSVVQTSDGGYAIAGRASYDFWLVNTDSAGNMQWNKTYGGTGEEYANSVVQSGDGGYAIVGTKDPGGAGGRDVWLVKTDAVGNAEWNKTYGGTAHDYGQSVVQTGDGGYAIAASTYSYGVGSPTWANFWLIKTYANGNVMWNRTYGVMGNDHAYSMVQTSDGGYAIAGDRQPMTYVDFWLVKTDSAGNMQWNKTYGGASDDIAYSVVQTSDGGYAIAGRTFSFGAGSGDFWLVKTDPTGNMKWNRTLGGTSGDTAYSVVQADDGGYAIAGSTYSYGAGNSDFWLVKLGPTIYIRADGSVDPPTAPIVRDGDIYTLTDNIYSGAPTAIVVEKNGITLDGAGYTIQGSSGTGIDLSGRSGVTVKNATIKSFSYGIKLFNSSGNFIQGNIIIDSLNGIWLGESSSNTLYRNFLTGSQNISIVLIDNSAFNTLTNNNITNNNYGVWFSLSPNNALSGNSITINDGPGVLLGYGSSGNTLIGNTIADNLDYGVKLVSCSSNSFYHNNFVDNSPAQVSILESVNAWDDGYPSGGNFWSDYKGTDIYNGPDQNQIGHDGIGDTSRIFDTDNRDNYPLMEPWPAPEAATIIIGTTARITVLDPAKAYDHYTWEVLNNIGEGLLKYKPGTTNLTCGIAESYTVSPDGLNYTFTLRSGLQFTDGEPLNATAVKWSIDRVIRLNQDPAFFVSDHVSSVDVLNPLTVRFNLKKAVAYFPLLVAEPPYFPVSSKSFPPDETAEPPVGHYGPYKIRSWLKDVELVLEANPGYDGAPPRSKYIVTKTYTNSTTMRQALENGQIDIAWKTLGGTDVTDLKKDLHFSVVETQDSIIRYMVLRCNMTPFDDVRLRRAVAAAINRTRIGIEAYSGLADPLYSMVPAGIRSHIDAFKDEYGMRNLTLSRELLTAAGYSESERFQFDLWYPLARYGGLDADVAAVMKSDLEETGMMQITLKNATWATYRANMEAGVMPTYLLGWWPDYPDPDDYLAPFVHSTRSLWLGADYNYNNTVMDAILNEAMVEQNMAERTTLYEDAQRLLAEDAPRIPFIQGRQYAVTKSNVIGVNLSLTSLLPYSTIYELTHPTEYPWAMFHHDLTHTGYSDSPTSRTNDKLWNYTTGSNVYSSPAVADGKVYVGSSDGKVYCLNALNGTCVWSYPTGDQIESSPAVSDLKVYVGSYDNKLYCLDALTGAHIWNYTTNNDVRSSPAVFDGKVYVGSLDGKVYCLDASTGAHVWNYTTGGSIFSSPAVDNGKVYIGSNDTKIYCLNALTGTHVWNYTTGNWVMSSPAVFDGKVYVGSDDRKLYCLDASTGVYKWSYTTGYSSEHLVRSSAAVAYGKVYVGSFDFKLYCLDASTGGFAWSYTTPSGFVYSSPALADGKVYVGSNNNIVYCLDALTGDYIWSYTTSGPATSSPAVADGIVFIGSNDKNLYAFGNIIKVPEDYPTVQAAVDAAPENATILVAPGIYHECVIISKTLTILGEKGSGSTFIGGGSGAAFTIEPGADGTNIAQNTITNYAYAVAIDNSAQCRIFDNIMYSMTDSGVAVKGSSAVNTLIYSNIFQNNLIAVNLTQSSTSNTIYGNTISYNNIGLLLKSGGNIIYANTIAQNNFGIKLQSSNDNFIYWNNFDNYVQQVDIQASITAWDKGYPMGGNYWSNYQGVDFYSGATTPQTQPGRDGIGDTPYTVYGDVQDHYPLMKPFGGTHDISIIEVICSKTIVGQGYTLTIQVTVISYGMYTETRNIKIYANSIIAAGQDATLHYRSLTTLTFTWTTAGFEKGDYNMKVYATPITGDDYTADNTLTDGVVKVVIPGDVNADGIVSIVDLSGVSAHWSGPPTGPLGYDPNFDINGDGTINMQEVSLISAYWTGPPKGPLAP